MIELRQLFADDWAVWRDLRLVALAEAPYAFGSQLADWQGEGDREERWRARLEVPGSYNIVAVLEGRPVGMVSGMPNVEDGAVELTSMWVSPAVRGHGVADQLIGVVEQWARQSHARILKLAVTPCNEHAIELYRRNGFVDSGELGDLMPDGTSRERVMAKTIRLV